MFAIPTKPVKSQYKYRIISSVILIKKPKIISVDICIDFNYPDMFLALKKQPGIENRKCEYDRSSSTIF